MENTSFDFNLMPNPNNGEFVIKLGNTSERNLQISVMNSIGAMVFSKQLANQLSQNINLNWLADGIYLVKVQNENINIIKRLVIQK